MFSFFIKHWFLISIACASAFGYLQPEVGKILLTYNILTIGLVLSFFLTGLLLKSQVVLEGLKSLKALVIAVISSLIFYPVIAWLFTSQLHSYELLVGCCIIAAGPVTVSSGTILTALARGNIPLSVFICIFTHFLAVFTIPFILDILLGAGAGVVLPVFEILFGLVLKVLLPLVIGQLVRPFLKCGVDIFRRPASIFQSCMILLMIMTAVASSAASLKQMGDFLVFVVAVVVTLHLFMLLFNYGIARLIRLDRPSLIAFTIHTPQKTLGVSYIVWAGFFAAEYPAAFVPAIVCHLSQMITGTLVAEHFRKNDDPEI